MSNSKLFEYAGECAKQSINIEFLISASLLTGIYGPAIGFTGAAGHFASCMLTKTSHGYIDSSEYIADEAKPLLKFSTQTLAGSLKYFVKYGPMMKGASITAKVLEGGLNSAAYYLFNEGTYAPVASEVSSGLLGDYLKYSIEGHDDELPAIVSASTANSAALNGLVGLLVVAGIKLHSEVLSPVEDLAFGKIANTTSEYFHATHPKDHSLINEIVNPPLFPRGTRTDTSPSDAALIQSGEISTCESDVNGECAELQKHVDEL